MERPRILAENRALAWSVLTFSPEIALSRRASSHSRLISRSRVERPRILAENRALEWSVLAFSPEIALSCGASSHSRLKSRSRVERPGILAYKIVLSRGAERSGAEPVKFGGLTFRGGGPRCKNFASRTVSLHLGQRNLHVGQRCSTHAGFCQ